MGEWEEQQTNAIQRGINLQHLVIYSAFFCLNFYPMLSSSSPYLCGIKTHFREQFNACANKVCSHVAKTLYTTATITSLSICNMTKLKSALKSIFVVELKNTHISIGKLNWRWKKNECGIKRNDFECENYGVRVHQQLL